MTLLKKSKLNANKIIFLKKKLKKFINSRKFLNLSKH
jgi:hypothetical protein